MEDSVIKKYIAAVIKKVESQNGNFDNIPTLLEKKGVHKADIALIIKKAQEILNKNSSKSIAQYNKSVLNKIKESQKLATNNSNQNISQNQNFSLNSVQNSDNKPQNIAFDQKIAANNSENEAKNRQIPNVENIDIKESLKYLFKSLFISIKESIKTRKSKVLSAIVILVFSSIFILNYVIHKSQVDERERRKILMENEKKAHEIAAPKMDNNISAESLKDRINQISAESLPEQTKESMIKYIEVIHDEQEPLQAISKEIEKLEEIEKQKESIKKYIKPAKST